MKHFFGLSFLLIIISLASCRKEIAIKKDGVNLRFSKDTVYLDTVFSTVGSSTYTLKVYNDNAEKVVVDNIRLENQSSYFRINVNGKPTKNINNVEILPKDSIYIFVEVTAGASGQKEMVQEDKILFTNKGTEQSVQLVSLAYDAIFHYPTNFLRIGEGSSQTIIPYSIICDETWLSGERHVIYGYAVVNNGCQLDIERGAEVYFHNNAGMWAFNGSAINIGLVGNMSDSVVFQGDRLEPFYENAPGQWGGVLGGLFIDDSARVNIDRTLIKNAVNAIRTDSAQFTDQLRITNSYILNSSRIALYGGFGSINTENVVIANAGLHGFYGFGGNYTFTHTTFANYWNQGTRTSAMVYLSNYLEYQDENGVQIIRRPLQSANFRNSIIYGSNTQELTIDKDDAEIMNYEFKNVLLKLDQDPEDWGFEVIGDPAFINPLINSDVNFADPSKNQYNLMDDSQAINQAYFDPNFLSIDIIQNPRSVDGQSDLGAYEYQGN